MNPTTTIPTLTLDEQLAVFRRNRFLTMPVTGMFVWTGIGIAGAMLPVHQAVLATYLGTGLIFYLALAVAKLLGEDILGRKRKGNFFDRVFLSAMAMSLLVFGLAIPFGMVDPSAVPLGVGVLTGLMWLPFSLLIGHRVGFFHAIARTALLVAAWYLFPAHRFVILPAVIVLVYLISIFALARRWRAINSANA